MLKTRNLHNGFVNRVWRNVHVSTRVVRKSGVGDSCDDLVTMFVW